MQVSVTITDDVFARLQRMADEEHITASEMLARIAERTVFSTATNVRPTNEIKGEVLKPRGSLLDLDGVGAELWKGIDAQEYVNALRSDWDAK